MIDPITMSRITHDAVVEKWGVEPRLVGDVLALAGDSSDNIPGVKGIGPKIAASLLQDFGNLDNLLERLDEVKQKARREKLQANIEMAKLSRQLVELERGIPLANMTFPEDMANVSDLRMEPMNRERLLDFFETMGFRDLKRRFQNRLDQLDRKRPRKNNKRPKATIPQPEEFEDVPF
jgi:DNA polymerase-1